MPWSMFYCTRLHVLEIEQRIKETLLLIIWVYNEIFNWTQWCDQIHLRDYGFLSFVKNMGSKYGQKPLDTTKISAIDALKTASKKAIQNNGRRNRWHGWKKDCREDYLGPFKKYLWGSEKIENCANRWNISTSSRNT